MTKNPTLSYEADVETDDPGGAEIRLRFSYMRGGKKDILLPRAMKHDIRAIRIALANAGGVLPDVSEAANKLIRLALKQKPRRGLIRVTDRSGWAEPGNVFVLPSGTYGDLTQKVEHRRSVIEQDMDEPEGSLDAWKAGVNDLCRASSFATFAIGLAFAGPLLRHKGQGTGIAFNLSGYSGTGKTTSLQVGRSVCGKADYADIPRLNITPTGLEELAAGYNDCFLPLDEFGSARLSTQGVELLIAAMSYGVREGGGRTRSKLGATTVGQSNLRWRIAVLTSSEHRIADMARRDPGEQARYIDIAVPSSEDGGICDLLVGGSAAERKALLDAVKITIANNHGVALEGLLLKLVKDVPRHIKQVTEDCAHFEKKVSKPSFKLVQSRYPEAFGIVYAALCLAVDLELVPFDRKHAKRAVLAVYRRSELQLIQTPAVHDQLKKLAGVLSDKSQCPDWVKGGPQPAAEIWAVRCENGGQSEFYIEPKMFERSWGKTETKAIEAHLLANGIQQRSSDGKSTRQPPGRPFAATKKDRPRVIVLDAAKFTDMIARFP